MRQLVVTVLGLLLSAQITVANQLTTQQRQAINLTASNLLGSWYPVTPSFQPLTISDPNFLGLGGYEDCDGNNFNDTVHKFPKDAPDVPTFANGAYLGFFGGETKPKKLYLTTADYDGDQVVSETALHIGKLGGNNWGVVLVTKVSEPEIAILRQLEGGQLGLILVEPKDMQKFENAKYFAKCMELAPS